MNSSESAEQMIKMSLEGLEVAAKITGIGAKNITVMLLALMKDKKRTKGKTTLNNMLKSGSQLNVFALKTEDLKKFSEEAKRYGVLFTALKNKNKTDGITDIIVRSEDAPKINRIVDKFKLASCVDVAEITSEIEKDKIKEMEKEAMEKGIPIKSIEEKLVDDIIISDNKEVDNIDPLVLTKNPSEPSSESKNKSKGFNSNKEKPSVKKDLVEIKSDIKEKVRNEQSKQNNQQTKTNNKQVNKTKKGKGSRNVR